MNIKELASLIAKREGRKSQVSVGDIREILALLCDLYYADPVALIDLFSKHAQKRNKKK